MKGTDYLARFAAIYDPKVEAQPAIQAAILQAFADGDVSAYIAKSSWRPVTVNATIDGKKRSLTYAISPWLEIGNVDPVLVPMEPASLQRIADRLGALLPSRKIVRDVFAQADLKIPLQTPGPPLVIGPGPHTVYPGTPTSDMQTPAAWREHDRLVKVALAGRSPADHVIAGHSKSVVIGPNLPASQLAIYGGWYGSMTPAPGLADGIFWQGYPGPHGSSWVDYSQDAFLVGREALLDGAVVDLADVFQDPHLNVLVSDQGPFVPHFPNAGLSPGGGKVVDTSPPIAPPAAPPAPRSASTSTGLRDALIVGGALVGAWFVGKAVLALEAHDLIARR